MFFCHVTVFMCCGQFVILKKILVSILRKSLSTWSTMGRNKFSIPRVSIHMEYYGQEQIRYPKKVSTHMEYYGQEQIQYPKKVSTHMEYYGQEQIQYPKSLYTWSTIGRNKVSITGKSPHRVIAAGTKSVVQESLHTKYYRQEHSFCLLIGCVSFCYYYNSSDLLNVVLGEMGWNPQVTSVLIILY